MADKAVVAGLRVGARVRVRDSDRESWKRGRITEVRTDGAVIVQTDGATRGFVWRFVDIEGDQDKPAPSGTGYSVGERVRVRDSERESWRTGSVVELRGDTPVVKVDGSSRGFTWAMVEKEGGSYSVGDRVRVRDSEKEAWLSGAVTEVREGKPLVRADKHDRAYTWTHIERDTEEDDAKAKAKAAAEVEGKKDGGIGVGSRVKVRDSDRESWREGAVVEMRGSTPMVKVDGQNRAFSWNQVVAAGDAGSGAQDKGFSVGDRVRARDTERESWYEGEVVEMRGATPVVKIDGRTRAFTWKFVETVSKNAGKPPPPSSAFGVGDSVRVRDTAKASWQSGVVTELRDGRPVVKVEGTSRAFTWEYVEAEGKPGADEKKGGFAVGDRVRVRDSERESWRNGAVTEVSGDRVVVKVDGSSRGFTWNMIEADGKPGADEKKGGGGFAVGDRVRVKDGEKEMWRYGAVTDATGPVVKVDGSSRGFTWKFVEPEKGAEPAAASKGGFAVGDRVRVRDSERESWRNGAVTEVSGDRVVVKVD
eukprot:Hpha_TRINITY_DN15207_c2_g11::TRINITY_DN15207_c2_g11_i1::g.67051::m.67051